MRYLLLTMLMASAFHAHAQSSIESGMKDMLAVNAMNSGATYQLAKRCGAEATALDAYDVRIGSDYSEMKASYEHLDVDFAKSFSAGKRVGDKQFKALGPGAEATADCKRALSALSCTGLMC